MRRIVYFCHNSFPATKIETPMWIPAKNSAFIADITPFPSHAQFYRDHGWFIAPPMIPETVLDEAMAGLEAHWAGHRDKKLVFQVCGFADWMPGDGEGTRNNEY